jgi:hypothetical protein
MIIIHIDFAISKTDTIKTDTVQGMFTISPMPEGQYLKLNDRRLKMDRQNLIFMFP